MDGSSTRRARTWSARTRPGASRGRADRCNGAGRSLVGHDGDGRPAQRAGERDQVERGQQPGRAVQLHERAARAAGPAGGACRLRRVATRPGRGSRAGRDGAGDGLPVDVDEQQAGAAVVGRRGAAQHLRRGRATGTAAPRCRTTPSTCPAPAGARPGRPGTPSTSATWARSVASVDARPCRRGGPGRPRPTRRRRSGPGGRRAPDRRRRPGAARPTHRVGRAGARPSTSRQAPTPGDVDDLGAAAPGGGDARRAAGRPAPTPGTSLQPDHARRRRAPPGPTGRSSTRPHSSGSPASEPSPSSASRSTTRDVGAGHGRDAEAGRAVGGGGAQRGAGTVECTCATSSARVKAPQRTRVRDRAGSAAADGGRDRHGPALARRRDPGQGEQPLPGRAR